MPAVFNGKLSYLNERRNLFVLLTSLFFLIDLSLFNKKWLAGRQYPNVPVFQFLTDIAPFWHELLFFFCILGTLLVIGFPKKGSKFALSFLILAITGSCALDIVRMQGPTLIALVGLMLLTIDDDIAPVQLMFVLFYFWVGFQKLNYNFITYGFANMFKNQPWFSVMQPYLGYIGAVGALYEMAVGLLLFFPSSRRMGLWLMVFVHGIILIMLSPVILNEDSYVWPYNIWLTLAVAVLFYKTENETTFFNLRPATMIVVLFFLVAPAANVFGHWDENLSFKFYSFNLRSAAIRFEDGSAWLNHKVFEGAPVKNNRLNIAAWGVPEIESTDFPSEWFYERFFSQLCSKMAVPSGDRSIWLAIYTAPNRFDGSLQRRVVFCP